jgi:hypothetical protein
LASDMPLAMPTGIRTTPALFRVMPDLALVP